MLAFFETLLKIQTIYTPQQLLLKIKLKIQIKLLLGRRSAYLYSVFNNKIVVNDFSSLCITYIIYKLKDFTTTAVSSRNFE